MNDNDMQALLQELARSSTIDDRQALLQRQMLQAEALRNPVSGNHTTGLGAALGGAGDVARSLTGSLQSQALNKQMQGLFGQQESAQLAAMKNSPQMRGLLGGVGGGAAGGGMVPGSAGAADAVNLEQMMMLGLV